MSTTNENRNSNGIGNDIHSMPEFELRRTRHPSTTSTSTSFDKCPKTLRLTENKRRYRARRKEYVSDLESRLAAAREQGVQASREVQIAAQQVAFRNARLRDLLLLVGFSADEIECWESSMGHGGAVEGGKDGVDASPFSSSCGGRRGLQAAVEQKARQCAAVLNPQGLGAVVVDDRGSPKGRTSTTDQDNILPPTSPPEAALNGNSCRTTAAHHQTPMTGIDTTDNQQQQQQQHQHIPILPTCKLLSRLSQNPAADITQVHAQTPTCTPLTCSSTTRARKEQSLPTASPTSLINGEGGGGGGDLEGEKEAQAEGDIECNKAYDMLIQYATTEEKMDTIARALEGGCTRSKGGKGGCAVRSEVVLQALDSLCK